MFGKRCVLCSTNKKNGKLICDDCSFIKAFIIKYGRENLKIIVTNFDNSYTSRSVMNNHIRQPNDNYLQCEPDPPILGCNTCGNRTSWCVC